MLIRRGDRASEMFFISSGAVEVVLEKERVRLGSGDFVGELALLTGRRRQADVVTLGFCRVLAWSAAAFRGFLEAYPQAKAEIDRIAEARTTGLQSTPAAARQPP